MNLDYHIEIDKHFYSGIFHSRLLPRRGRSAHHTQDGGDLPPPQAGVGPSAQPAGCNARPTTLADHMPSSHRRYREWTHERILREAASIGDDTMALAEIILRSRPHPEQGFRSCIGILRLAERYDAERLDAAACTRAAGDRAPCSYSSWSRRS